MNPHLQNILHLIQQDDKLSAKEKESIIRSLEHANKELEITAFKLERTEKVKKTTAVLLEETIGELEKKRKDVEAQNRELEIESALERVRSATMSMRDSSELGNLIFHLYAELTKLDAKLDRCFIMIVNPETLGITWWLSRKEGLLDENGFLVQNNDYPSHQLYLKHWREKTTNWQYLLEGKEKEEWDQFGFSKTELAKLPEAVKRDMSGVKKTWLSGSSDSFGCLLTGSLERLSEEHQNILSRFTKVFNQTYTRFLDLQKAEAQAREAQIQLALERVRARAMAMQKPSELTDVAQILRTEMRSLGVEELETSSIYIHHEDSGNTDCWYAIQKDNKLVSDYMTINLNDTWVGREMLSFYRSDRKKTTIVMKGEERKEWINYCSEHSNVLTGFYGDNIPDRSYHLYKFSNGYMGAASPGEISAESWDLLQRATSVFSLAYTRFNDLQLAEAQAREAQIETALERVRSRTMGMQKSEELKDVIRLVYEQFIHLKIHIEHTGFLIDYKTRDDVLHIWLADEHLAPSEVTIPWFDCPPNNSIRDAKNKGEDFFKYHLTFEEKNKFYRDLFQFVPGVPEETIDYYQNCPGLAGSGVLLESIGLYIENFSGTPYTDEENAVLMRFGKVFQQTYTRFLDLQKAEAQSREAQIQLALERVRARTMAMQKSDELGEVALLLFEQVRSLGIETYASGFNIFNQVKKNLVSWMSNPTGSINPPFEMPVESFKQHQKIYEAWKNNEDFLEDDLTGEALAAHYKFLRSHPLLDEAFKKSEAAGIETPGRQVHNIAIFSQGFLLFITFEPHPEFRDIFIRFAKVFEQTYTRFLDLQKAEAQAREAQIEAALERVRARTMAMQKSDELQDAASLLFQQIQALGIPAWSCGYNIFQKEDTVCTSWMSNHGQMQPPIHIPLKENATFIRFKSSKEKGEEFWIEELQGKKLKEHYGYLFSLPEVESVATENKKNKLTLPVYQINHVVNFSHGNLLFITYEHVPEAYGLFKRFGTTFEQTYSRFLDLQKAEAQARESQIQLALERVRARTMAMQKSEELLDVINIFSEQLTNLNIYFDNVSFGVNKQTDDFKFWMSSAGQSHPIYIVVPYCNNPAPNRVIEAQKDGLKFFADILTPEENRLWFQHLVDHSEIRLLPDKVKSYVLSSPGFARSTFIMKNINLYIGNYKNTPYTEEENNIFYRFAQAFEQSYIRFLDLQKAEAQAREAQIEAALERVRSRTMAMQRSDELNPTADLLFDQLKKLGADLQGVAFTICDKNSIIITKWTSIGIFSFPYTIEPAEQNMYEAWKNQVPLYEEVFEGERLRKYYETLMEVPAFKQGLQKMLDAGFPIPTWQKNHAVSFQQGYLLAITTKPFEETQIFVRFGKVFEQTYTRFLDLQKAEAQAREAQIEAALERVRSKAMSMHTSTELKEVASEMRNQLHLLGQKALETCAIHLYDVTPDYIETWAALRLPDSEDEMVKVEASYPKKGIRILEETIKNYSSKKMDYVLEVDKANEIELFEEIKNRAPAAYKVILESTKGKVDDDVWVYWSLSDFPGGSLVMVTHKLPEENERKLLRRFSNVFGLAYQRFSDLQKAETSAREAIKQAALDRIRADIASMRTTEDLERITPVIWTELKILGIPFIRCGVFVMDEEKELIHTFLSTPEGKAITAIHIPYNTPGKIQLIPENWRANNPYTDLWQDTDFVDFANILTQQKVITSPDEYLSGVPHGGFYLHFVPFVQGMMYVGNTTKLSEEEINLIQSLADAFSTAYARYEDFNKLEAAKKQVDSTITELQSTQKQLIQSEKMASLGELTAGIAHEIQNPLNFVNNFSEVSKELLDEMREAMEKGDSEEAKEIMQDVIANLEKINHHGQRAGDIVKGMLQHSRTSTGQKEMTDINALCDEYVRLAYHGLRAKDKSFNAEFKTEFDSRIEKINIVPQDMGRVILNLINNAFYAVNERKKLNEPGYEPAVTVSTKYSLSSGEDRGEAIITVKDNGTGIPEKIKDKIFQPFFTTKPTGQGTGLGLSLVYDIVKAHGGEIKVKTKEGEGSEFIIQLRIN